MIHITITIIILWIILLIFGIIIGLWMEAKKMTAFEDQRRDTYFKNMENMSRTILTLVETLNSARKENNFLAHRCEELEAVLKKKKNA